MKVSAISTEPRRARTRKLLQVQLKSRTDIGFVPLLVRCPGRLRVAVLPGDVDERGRDALPPVHGMRSAGNRAPVPDPEVRSELMARATQRMRCWSEERAEKVEALRLQVEAGLYHVDSMQLAERMLVGSREVE